jgi:hypothetical protein
MGFKDTVSGMEGDGMITLIHALAGAAAVFFTQDRLASILGLVASAIILIVGAIDFFDIGSAAGDLGNILGKSESRGFGLYLKIRKYKKFSIPKT